MKDPKPKNDAVIRIRLPKELKAKVEAEAKWRGISVSTLIRKRLVRKPYVRKPKGGR